VIQGKSLLEFLSNLDFANAISFVPLVDMISDVGI